MNKGNNNMRLYGQLVIKVIKPLTERETKESCSLSLVLIVIMFLSLSITYMGHVS